MKLPSYPKIWNLGHGAVTELLWDDVVVEEKVDGSQFSFGRKGDEVFMRSKGQELIPGKEKMFLKAEETVNRLAPQLQDGWVYRGEYLQKAKHNVLAYDRAPAQNIILFDICPSEETYLSREQKEAEAARLGLETVPALFVGKVDSVNHLAGFLDQTSCLGGQKIEGFVIKNYRRFGPDNKALMGKHVSEAFKEHHKKDWKQGNPNQGDIVIRLINAYTTGARWDKAILHLKERGELENAPKDLAKIIPEVAADVEQECGDEVKAVLWAWAWPQIKRGIMRGLPEYYKQKLAQQQVEGDGNEGV